MTMMNEEDQLTLPPVVKILVAVIQAVIRVQAAIRVIAVIQAAMILAVVIQAVVVMTQEAAHVTVVHVAQINYLCY